MTDDHRTARDGIGSTSPTAKSLRDAGIYLSEATPLECGCHVHWVLWEADLIWRHAETLCACALHRRHVATTRRRR